MAPLSIIVVVIALIDHGLLFDDHLGALTVLGSGGMIIMFLEVGATEVVAQRYKEQLGIKILVREFFYAVHCLREIFVEEILWIVLKLHAKPGIEAETGEYGRHESGRSVAEPLVELAFLVAVKEIFLFVVKGKIIFSTEEEKEAIADVTEFEAQRNTQCIHAAFQLHGIVRLGNKPDILDVQAGKHTYAIGKVVVIVGTNVEEHCKAGDVAHAVSIIFHIGKRQQRAVTTVCNIAVTRLRRCVNVKVIGHFLFAVLDRVLVLSVQGCTDAEGKQDKCVADKFHTSTFLGYANAYYSGFRQQITAVIRIRRPGYKKVSKKLKFPVFLRPVYNVACNFLGIGAGREQFSDPEGV